MPSNSANSVDCGTVRATDGELEQLCDALSDRDVDPVVVALLETLVAERERLEERVAELEEQLDRTHDIATTASGKRETNDSRLDELERDHEETREIARSAVAKAQQADADQQEDAESLPQDVQPSSSPLDFFANCREQTVKEIFVERRNRQNTYRPVKVAKRWPEFATERVWSKLQELGGEDLRMKSRQVGRRQSSTQLLVMDRETAEGLLDKRYLGLDLLERESAARGGVTPVVTGADRARV